MKRLIVFAVITFATVRAARPATVLVTGSNRGLGFEFVKQYAEMGWTVIATARNPESATELRDLAAKNKNITVEKLDLLDQSGIKTLAAKYRGKPIDVLLNNAGVLGNLQSQTLGTFDYAGFEEVMAVNVYGALAVSEAFTDSVATSEKKKIVAVTSGAGSISTGRGSGSRMYFYSTSKLALNMVMRILAGDLRSRGVIVGMISPGAADTDMRRALVGAERAARDLRPVEAVTGMIKVIDGLTQTNSDKPLSYDGRVLPW